MASDRRARKRLDMRQNLSNIATRLFLERGFDRVTVDEIAAAADVGRMTVFNHFPRKEDLFFDLDEAGRAILREAIRRREPGVSPVETLRRLAHRLVAERSPYVEFSARSRAYVEAIEASETLRARARAIGGEVAQVVAASLAESVGGGPDDPGPRLAAGLLVATWSVALLQAHRALRLGGDSASAGALFLAVVDRASAGIEVAMADPPLRSPHPSPGPDAVEPPGRPIP